MVANFILLATIGLLSLAGADQLHCYMPDGSNADAGTAPCNSTAAVSACCDPRDSCTTSGLCLGASGWIYRSACTDQSWTSPVCAQQCHADPLTKITYSSFAPIVPCAAGVAQTQYCCESSDGNCCSANFTLGLTGLAFKPGTDALLAELANATSRASAAAAATVTVTATSSPSSSSPPSPSSSASSNLGLAVGAGVGIPLGILALGILGLLFRRESHSRRDAKAAFAAQLGSHPLWAQLQSSQMLWDGRPAGSSMHTAPPQFSGSSPVHPGGGLTLQSQYQSWKTPKSEGQVGVHELRG